MVHCPIGCLKHRHRYDRRPATLRHQRFCLCEDAELTLRPCFIGLSVRDSNPHSNSHPSASNGCRLEGVNGSMHPLVPYSVPQAPPNNTLALRAPPPRRGPPPLGSRASESRRRRRRAGDPQSESLACLHEYPVGPPDAPTPTRPSRRGETDHPDHPAGPCLNTPPAPGRRAVQARLKHPPSIPVAPTTSTRPLVLPCPSTQAGRAAAAGRPAGGGSAAPGPDPSHPASRVGPGCLTV